MNLDDSTTFTFDTAHTPLNPYCDDVSCWCHSTSDYHDVVTQPFTGEAEAPIAYAFFGVQGISEVQA